MPRPPEIYSRAQAIDHCLVLVVILGCVFTLAGIGCAGAAATAGSVIGAGSRQCFGVAKYLIRHISLAFFLALWNSVILLTSLVLNQLLWIVTALLLCVVTRPLRSAHSNTSSSTIRRTVWSTAFCLFMDFGAVATIVNAAPTVSEPGQPGRYKRGHQDSVIPICI